jgi:hypothetical protein
MTDTDKQDRLTLIAQLEQEICKPDGCSDPACQALVIQIAYLDGEIDD